MVRAFLIGAFVNASLALRISGARIAHVRQSDMHEAWQEEHERLAAADPDLCTGPCNPWITSRGPQPGTLATKLVDDGDYSSTIYDGEILTVADSQARGSFMKQYGSEWVLVFDKSPGSNGAQGNFQVDLDGSGVATYSSSGSVLVALKARLPSDQVWANSVVKVVTCAAVGLMKFSQIPEFRKWLLHSGGAHIIRTSKSEGTWGVGELPYAFLDSLDKISGNSRTKGKLEEFSLRHKDRKNRRPTSFTYYSDPKPNPEFDPEVGESWENKKEIRDKFHHNVIDSNCLGKALMIVRAILSRESDVRPRTSLGEALLEVLVLLKETAAGSLRHNLDLAIMDDEVLPAIVHHAVQQGAEALKAWANQAWH